MTDQDQNAQPFNPKVPGEGGVPDPAPAPAPEPAAPPAPDESAEAIPVAEGAEDAPPTAPVDTDTAMELPAQSARPLEPDARAEAAVDALVEHAATLQEQLNEARAAGTVAGLEQAREDIANFQARLGLCQSELERYRETCLRIEGKATAATTG